MALNIKRARVDELARRSAELRDVSITDAVEAALERDVIELEKAREARMASVMEKIGKIQAEIAAMPVRDPRPTRQIQDELNQDIFDSHGLRDFVRR
jgi:hypothetical protein